MSDGNAQLGGDNRTGHRGIHIADHEHEIGLLAHAGLFEFHHDAGGLLGVRSGADAKVHIGNRDAQLAEEHIRHAFVVVLARVDQNPLQAGRLLHLLHDRRDLHEVGPRTHDVQNFHGNIP